MNTMPATLNGLTDSEVAERRRDGRVNVAHQPTSRTIGAIIRDNCLTLFNAILLACLAVVVTVGSLRDGVFAGVLVLNAATGIMSEIRAKITLDKLAILSTTPLSVIRDGSETQVAPSDIVVDDLVVLRPGDQVPADGEIVESRGLEIDEAILTGESEPERKNPSDRALSGSSVVAGEGHLLVDAVGEDAWAYKMSSDVKRFEMAHSELSAGIDTILTWLTRILPLMILVLGFSQIDWSRGLGGVLASGQWRTAVLAIVAALVGMIPQGLVLLTSVNFAAASLKLARNKVLVQELPAVEVLARVDVLCLDKTGTITTGAISCQGALKPGQTELKPLGEVLDETTRRALAQAVADRTNATATAIGDKLGETCAPQWRRIPFSSARKWSAVIDEACWILGAPEIVCDASTNGEEARRSADAIAAEGARIVAFARGSGSIEPDKPSLPSDLEVVCLVVLSEEIRPDAAETLAYFAAQGVDVKIISGDSPTTVGAIARRAGIGDVTVCDARTLPAPSSPVQSQRRGRRDRPAREVDPEFGRAIERANVFGRVSPEQKRALVHALQQAGHTVAMTGDGVNDSLALKDADLGIAMGNGAQATKASAKIVLLDSSFSRLPAVVAEGRRVLGNMERVSTLFLAKTLWAFVIAMTVSLCGLGYPFLPRHLTLIGVFTIGVPAFLLALAPSAQRYRPGFLPRVLKMVLPAGAAIGLSGVGVYWWALPWGGHMPQTAATLVITGLSLALLAVLARPLLTWRGLLVAAMGACVVCITLVPVARRFFALEWPSMDQWVPITGIVVVVGAFILAIGQVWVRRHYRGDSHSAVLECRDERALP
ncbi:MAG: HAD-IC family P-type ATPase [Actinomycetaceae bacterium]|nr:HAD-IC family P-type ATPase [Actinomycetaceae bacterium]